MTPLAKQFISGAVIVALFFSGYGAAYIVSKVVSTEEVVTSDFLKACSAPTPESGQRLGCALVIQGYIAGHDTLVALNPSVERKAFCVPPTVSLGTVLDSAERWTFEHPADAAGIMEQAGNSGALAIITMVLARDYPCSKDPKVGV